MTSASAPAPPVDVSVRLIRLLAGSRHGLAGPVALTCAAPGAAPAAPAHATGGDTPATGAGVAVTVRLDGCLADLPTYTPIELLQAGVTSVHLWPGSCVAARRALARTFEPLHQLVGDRLVCVPPAGPPAAPTLDLAAPEVGRRALLGRRQRVDLPDVAAGGHRRLVTALRAVVGADVPALPTPGLAMALAVAGDPGCVACGVCVRSCPEGALHLQVEGSVARLHQARERCTATQACVAACPQGVLTSRPATWPEVLREEPEQLAAVDVTACARCGAPTPTALGAWCPVCRYRLENPFGSHLPPAAARLARRHAG